jgi:hypothetical protein
VFLARYYSNNQIKITEVGGELERVGERKGIKEVLGGGKPEGKKPLGRRRIRWEDYIKVHLLEIVSGIVAWIDLFQDRYTW